MDFDDRAELDPSQVEDVGGSGFRGGGIVIGGGAVGIIALIVALLFGVDPTAILGGGEPEGRRPAGDLSRECTTGADADQSAKCRVVGVVNSIQKYWRNEISGYTLAKTTLFTAGVQTGCGYADSSVGPFYCPLDRHVYLDLSFFAELRSRFGAEGGPFAQAYVIAHEYGHHVQNLLGTMDAVGRAAGATSGSVRLELQADCYAGVWAKNAVRTGFYATEFTDDDIREALDAAAAVGDDRIQKRTRGRVDPEAFTHGTSEQRVRWFSRGYRTGDMAGCDTFSGGV